MNRTNSNSITSILIYALNNKKSSFRNRMMEKFGLTPNNNICFYDGTHSQLLLPEMKNKQVDIYAREFGKDKILLMIEIKANIYETLQLSQGKHGEYFKTANNYNIPLYYIIPSEYHDRDNIPKNIIEWETILEISESCKDITGIAEQIRNFVDLNESSFQFTEDEKELFYNPIKLNRIYNKRIRISNVIKEVMESTPKQNSWEFGAYKGNRKYFLGYSYICKNYDDYNPQFLPALTIAETEGNSFFDREKFYYYEGWYYLPIHKINGIKAPLVDDLLKDKKITSKIFGHKTIGIDNLKKTLIVSVDIKLICSFIEKIKFLLENPIITKKFQNVGNFKITDQWFGYYCTKKHSKKKNNIFIGFDYSAYYKGLEFVIEFWKEGDFNEPYTKIHDINPELFEKFINSKDDKELITRFENLIDIALTQ